MQQKNKDLMDKIREVDNIKLKYEEAAKSMTQQNPNARASIRLSKMLTTSQNV